MAYSRTLTELELAVRREADMVNSQFVTSEELRSYINQSWAELYDRIVLFDQEYLLRYTDIPSSAASSEGTFDILYDGATGVVREILSFTAGAAYVDGPAFLSQGGNVSATVTLTTALGAITAVTLTGAGNGYTSVTPTVNTQTLDVVQGVNHSGTVDVFLESDFYKCKGVWISNGSPAPGGGWDPLRRFQWDQQNMLRQAGSYFQTGFTALPLYRLFTLNGREKVGIAPMIGGTYRVWYYPAPYKMLVGTDRIDGRSGWDEWVVKDAAIKCLLKEESVEQAASIKAIRDELFSRFQLHASERDASQPEKIRNVNLLSRRAWPWR
jgi:hypothetical protein